MHKIRTVPLTEAEFQRLSGHQRVRNVKRTDSRSVHERYFPLLWLAGVTIPALIGMLIVAAAPANPIAILLLLVGIGVGLANLILVFATDWYRSGSWAARGRLIALVTGWVSAIIVGVVLTVIALLVLFFVFAFLAALIMLALGAGSKK